ncbi:recombinase family protein [Halopseudomonas pachastrellae]|nr:recombinase family protein [Halopseudomonas pachastrellae]
MHGQVDRGYIAGGKSYGYDIVKDETGSRYVINEEQAHWVRWIFQRAANGHPYRHIVYELNAKGVPAPRGDSWAVSALYGNPLKGGAWSTTSCTPALCLEPLAMDQGSRHRQTPARGPAAP